MVDKNKNCGILPLTNMGMVIKEDSHFLKKFWVVAVISNPVRFKSRFNLYHDFEDRMKKAGVNLLTVEAKFGDRNHQVTISDNPTHIQVQVWDEIWSKENLINIGISRLPADWEFVAWIDADISFLRPDWALETCQQLQHHQIVQMFQTAIDTGPEGEAFQTYKGFGWSHIKGLPYPKGGKYYPYYHPGYCWAARREAIDHLGGLIDFAILGAADHHMALSLIGKGSDSIPNGINKNYISMVLEWQNRAEKHIRRDIGYVPGTIIHYWHGRKSQRQYWNRWDILKNNNFDPAIDLKRDWQGLFQLTESNKNIKLRDDIRAYFRARNEDSIDTE